MRQSLLALILTLPVFFGLSRIDALARWVGGESVWAVLSPVFRLSDAAGIEQQQDVLLSVLLLASFLLSAAIVRAVGYVAHHLHHLKA